MAVSFLYSHISLGLRVARTVGRAGNTDMSSAVQMVSAALPGKCLLIFITTLTLTHNCHATTFIGYARLSLRKLAKRMVVKPVTLCKTDQDKLRHLLQHKIFYPLWNLLRKMLG